MTEKQPHVPAGSRDQLARYLGVAAGTEEHMRDALLLVAERHAKNFEVSHGATVLAIWSTEHLATLERFCEQYGRQPSDAAARLRDALFQGSRTGPDGELDDVCDLAVLAQKAEMTWTILVQGARELHDDGLLDASSRARDQTRRQIAWLRTIVEHEAPDAIAVTPAPGGAPATATRASSPTA